MIAEAYIGEGYPVNRVLKVVGIPSSSYYYRPVPHPQSKGIVKSKYTYTHTGDRVRNSQVVAEIEELLSHEFVDYGYIKVTHWLRQEKHYIINKKKVYRLMKEADLLNKRRPKRRSKRNWVKELVPKPSCDFEYLEVDIKYMYIPGQRRNALLLSVIDVSSRWVLGQYMAWQINKYDVKNLFDRLFNYYALPDKVYVRNDNGSQFEAMLVQHYFAKHNITQEFTKPATPEQNAHIEAYHSILNSVVCTRFDFENLIEAQQTMNRFIKFYNFERIHSGIGYMSPNKYLFQKGTEIKLDQSLLETFCCASSNINQKSE